MKQGKTRNEQKRIRGFEVTEGTEKDQTLTSSIQTYHLIQENKGKKKKYGEKKM